MRFLPVDPRAPTVEDVQGVHGVLAGAAAHDHPDVPAPDPAEVRAELMIPWPGVRSALWLSFDDGRPMGVAWLTLPPNDEGGRLRLEVLPGDRRRGAARGLMREAVRMSYSSGRTELCWYVTGGAAGAGFSRVLGARPTAREVRAVLSLGATVAPVVPAGYELERVVGGSAGAARGVASVRVAVAGDADTTAEDTYAAVVAARDAVLAERGVALLRVLARHRPSGAVVGVAEVHISPRSARAEQSATLVSAAHRRQGLGTALSAELLQWTAQAHPRVRDVVAVTADDDPAGQGLRVALGYRETGSWQEWRSPTRDLAGRLGMV